MWNKPIKEGVLPIVYGIYEDGFQSNSRVVKSSGVCYIMLLNYMKRVNSKPSYIIPVTLLAQGYDIKKFRALLTEEVEILSSEIHVVYNALWKRWIPVKIIPVFLWEIQLRGTKFVV